MKNQDIISFVNKHKLITIVFLNVFFLVFFLIFFEPFFSVDDDLIASDLYGLYTEKYNNKALYTTSVYSQLIYSLLAVCDEIPWHTVISYALVFCALSLVSYTVLQFDDKRTEWIICILVILFFGYEGYICMQWTKVSALALGAGFFLLCSPIKKMGWRIVALLELLLGGFLRSANISMAIGIWGVTLAIQLGVSFFKKDNDKVRQTIKRLIEVGCIYLSFTLVFMFTNSKNATSDEWNTYNEWNAYRSELQDYGMPPYEQNRDVYEKYNITEDERDFVYSWGVDINNIELYNKLISAKQDIESEEIVQQNHKGILNTFRDFFHQYPMNFLKIDVFFCYLILIIMLFASGRKKSGLFATFASFGLLMILNYYLYSIKGRFLIHRVDVGVIFNICLMLLYLCFSNDKRTERNYKDNKLVFIVLLLLLMVPYKTFGDDLPFISNEEIRCNKLFAENSMRDSHLYLYANQREGNPKKIVLMDIFQKPIKGILKNTYGLKMPTPPVQSALSDMGISDPYKEIVDGTNIYFVTDKNENMRDEIVGYIGTRVGKEVEATCVKKILDKHIFRLNSDSLTEVYKFKNLTTNCSKVVNGISYEFKKDDLILDGILYVEGENDFYQNVYVEIDDAQSEQSQLYYTLQEQNKSVEVGKPGWCSNISGKIQLPDFYDAQDEIYLIIETLDSTYKYKVSI